MIRGRGFEVALIVNESAAVTPPPGDGVETVIETAAAFWISAEETRAVSVLMFTNRVLSAPPFQVTVEAGVKLYPVTVRVKVGWPALIFVGESAEMRGPG